MDGNTDDEFKDLFPEPTEVRIGKHVFRVRALDISEMGKMASAVRLAGVAMDNGEQSDAYLGEHADELIPLIAAATGIARETIAKLPGGVVLTLYAAALHVNRDFFVQCFALRYGETAKLIVDILAPGPTPSTTSKTAATPSASATLPPASAASSPPPNGAITTSTAGA